MFCIFTLGDSKGGAKNLSPLVLGFVFIGITACFGWETGFAINPARDFGPRLMTAALGYGRGVWTVKDHYFWVRIVLVSSLSLSFSTFTHSLAPRCLEDVRMRP
jgi:aquaglyceroporin related protein, other eukaryote